MLNYLQKTKEFKKIKKLPLYSTNKCAEGKVFLIKQKLMADT